MTELSRACPMDFTGNGPESCASALPANKVMAANPSNSLTVFVFMMFVLMR
jgi:hypothetical protein